MKLNISLLTSIFCLVFVASAHAFNAPSNGDMWYDAYEVFFNRLIAGPIGGTMAGGLLCWGIISAIRGSMAQFVICSCAAAVIFNLENVVTGFGLNL